VLNWRDTQAKCTYSRPRHQVARYWDTGEVLKRELWLQPSEWDPTPGMAKSRGLWHMALEQGIGSLNWAHQINRWCMWQPGLDPEAHFCVLTWRQRETLQICKKAPGMEAEDPI
jgi:hypothetical protein